LNRFEEAEELFHRGEFIREEFGTNPNLVYLEVQLQKAVFHSRSKQCDEAASVIAAMGEAIPELPFTEEGAESFLNDARVQYTLGRSSQNAEIRMPREHTGIGRCSERVIVTCLSAIRRLRSLGMRTHPLGRSASRMPCPLQRLIRHST